MASNGHWELPPPPEVGAARKHKIQYAGQLTTSIGKLKVARQVMYSYLLVVVLQQVLVGEAVGIAFYRR